MLFRSKQPDVVYPTDLTVWEWAFEDKGYSPIYNFPRNELAGFTNAITKARLDFLEVKEHATHISTALVRKYGFQASDTVSLFSQNTIWYPVAMFAALRIGGKINGASPAYSVDEMSHALKTAETRYLMTVPDSIKVAIAAAKEAGIPKEHIFLLEGELPGYTTLQELVNVGKNYGEEGQTPVWNIPSGKKNKDVCGFLNFSSGTTGLAKAVMLSHENAIAQSYQLRAVAPLGRKKFLAQLPLFHISGLVRFLNWPVFSNDECIMLPKFSMEDCLKAVVEFQIEDLTLVPPLVIRLVHDPTVKEFDLSCLKRLSSSAAPLSPEIIQQLEKKMPWTGFRQSYGMTETCGCVSTHPPEFYAYKYANSGGTVVPSTILKVVDVDTRRELGPNEVGEILVKGPQVAMGYLGNPKATAETFGTDGYLHTGDIGSIDDGGFVHIVDRIKEMIKVKGQQVAPAELEDLLLGHPLVQDCAVLGIKDDYSGERPKAYIVLKEHLMPSEGLGRELIRYVKERRVRYKWVTEIEFTDTIPKNPSGKILRRVLRSQEQAPRIGLVVKDVAVRASI